MHPHDKSEVTQIVTPMKKNVNIYIPAGKRVYYANFRFQGKQINQSTGATNKATAQRIANKKRADMLDGHFDVMPKLRDDTPTVGKVIDVYRERSRVASAKAVAADFLTVVAEGNGITDPARRHLARDLRLTKALTADTMLAFRDRKGNTRSPISTDKMMRSARSIFSARARELYRGIKLPELSAWLKVAPLGGGNDKKFQRIPESTLALMDGSTEIMLRLARRKKKPDDRRQWINAWACYWVMRRCGLRNSEVENLRLDWIEGKDAEGDLQIWLIKREDWKPKGTEGKVPMARDLYQKLVSVLGKERVQSDDDKEPVYLLVGTKTDRKEAIRRHVNTYVKRFLTDRPTEKFAYELRKQWGSEMARLHGIETAAKLLRHADIKTAWDHYFDDLKLQSVEAL